MGGAPPPRLAAANISHFLPQCNPSCTFSPTRPHHHRHGARKPTLGADFCPIRSRPARAFPAQAGLQAAPLHVPLHGRPLRAAGRAAYDRCALRRGSQLLAAASVAILVLAALLVAGCGSSHAGGTDADPATAVPATAPLYVGATVRPSGSQESEALAAGKALTGQADPYERLLGALQTPGSPPLDYKRDVAPWLGPHAGLFARSLSSAGALLAPLTASISSSGQIAPLPFSASGLDGALVMDTRDTAPRGRSWPGRPSTRARIRAATAASHTKSPRAASPSASSGASR